MLIAASEDELGSGDDDSAVLPPSGRVALPESDLELTAMLSWAAESIGLHWRPPPSPKRSRLDDWFLGARADRRQPSQIPFFLEVHEEVTRSWRAACFLPETELVLLPSSLPSMEGWLKGMWRSPPLVERASVVQLCPRCTATWRGNLRFPSKACGFLSFSTAEAYRAAERSSLRAPLLPLPLLQRGPSSSLHASHSMVKIAGKWPSLPLPGL